MSPYYNAAGDTAAGVPARIETGKQVGVDWHDLSSKVSVAVGLATLAVLLHTFKRK